MKSASMECEIKARFTAVGFDWHVELAPLHFCLFASHIELPERMLVGHQLPTEKLVRTRPLAAHASEKFILKGKNDDVKIESVSRKLGKNRLK